MSDDNKPVSTNTGTLGAPTIREALAAARRDQGFVEKKAAGGDAPSQVKVSNRASGPSEGSKTGVTSHVVQQPSLDRPGTHTKQGEEIDDKGQSDQKEAMRLLKERMFGKTIPKEEDSSGDAKGQEEDSKKGEEDTKPSTDDTAAKKKSTTLSREKPVSLDQIAKVASEAATRAATAARAKDDPQPSTPQHPRQSEIDALSESDRNDLEIYRTLEKLDPAKHKNLGNRLLDEIAAKRAYKSEWQKAHPGEKFDWQAEEHEQFLDETEVPVTDREINRAVVRMEAESMLDDERKKSQAKIRELERKLASQSAVKEIEAATTEAVTSLKGMILPEGAAVEDDDPVVGEILKGADDLLKEIIGETVNLFAGATQLDRNNVIHQRLANWEKVAEQAILGDPSVQEKGGRQFVRVDEYWKMPEAQRGNFWTVGTAELINIATNQVAESAKADMEEAFKRAEVFAKRLGGQFDRAAYLTPKQEDGKKKKPDSAPQTEEQEPAIPSNTSGQKIGPGVKGGNNDNQSFAKVMMSQLFPQ